MSGHSKWSQIKHKKGLSDQKKGQLFSKLSKKISITAKDDPDPASNFRLQAIVDEAKSANMPRENIERAIKRAGDKNTSDLKEVIIQAIGPGSVAIIIEAITDNSNRTIHEIKNILTDNETKLAEVGSLDWMFNKKSIVSIKASDSLHNEKTAHLNEEDELQLIGVGAEDIKIEDDQILIISSPEYLESIRKLIIDLGFTLNYARLSFVPKNIITVDDIVTRQRLEKLFEELNNNDDVESIYSNLES